MGSVPHWESKDYDLDGFPNPHLEFSREARSELDLEDPCCAEMNHALKKTKRRKRANQCMCRGQSFRDLVLEEGGDLPSPQRLSSHSTPWKTGVPQGVDTPSCQLHQGLGVRKEVPQ